MSALLNRQCDLCGVIFNRLIGLQHDQPQLYDNLTKILNADEQQIVQRVVVRAEEIQIQAQAQAQAQSAAVTTTIDGTTYQVNGGAH